MSLDLARQLMAIDSTSGQEGEVVAWMQGHLERRGWKVARIPVTAGRDNLFASAVPEPLVTLSTHLDTVPPFIAPRIEGSRLYGRGACDAKGIAAAMVAAGETLRERGAPVALLFVVGEEVTHDGAHAANAVPTTSRVLINGEPTESTLALGTKGALRVTIRTSGIAAHSAYPHLGKSATQALVRLLAELETLEWPSDPVLGDTTLNIGVLSGGVADNVVAPTAHARLMIRVVSSPEEVLSRLREWAGSRAVVEAGAAVPAVRLGTLPGFATSVAAFATDIPALDRWGIPYLYGPGSIHVAHRDDEYIEIAELERAVHAYVRIAELALERNLADEGRGAPADAQPFPR